VLSRRARAAARRRACLRACLMNGVVRRAVEHARPTWAFGWRQGRGAGTRARTRARARAAGGACARRPKPPPPPGVCHNITAPLGRPDDDAWLGNISIDPARGRGRRPPRGGPAARASLFPIVQPGRAPACWEGPGAVEAAAALADAWLGNPAIAPDGGRRAPRGESGAGRPAAAEEHLWGATFRAPAGPAGAGEASAAGQQGPVAWSDLPRIGRRPLTDPVTRDCVEVRAVHALRQQDPLPPGVRPPDGRQAGKQMAAPAARPGAVDAYALLTFKDLGGSGGSGGGSGGAEDAARWRSAWNDAAHQPRRRAPAAGGSGRAAAPGEPGLLDFAPNRAARFVPFGGLAQEKGMSLDAVAAIAAIVRKGGGTMARGASAGKGKGKGGGGRKA
jgi:hypothetical protein